MDSEGITDRKGQFRKDSGFEPTMVDGCGVYFVPSHLSNMHILELVDVIQFRWSDATVILINHMMDVPSTIMGLETLDNACIHGLHIQSQICQEVLVDHTQSCVVRTC